MTISRRDLERMIELRKQRGWSVRRIAHALGVSKSKVDYHLLKWGIEPPGAPRARRLTPDVYLRRGRPVRVFTEAEDALLREFADAPGGQAALARRLDRAISSIRLRLFALARHEARAEASRDRRAA